MMSTASLEDPQFGKEPWDRKSLAGSTKSSQAGRDYPGLIWATHTGLSAMVGQVAVTSIYLGCARLVQWLRLQPTGSSVRSRDRAKPFNMAAVLVLILFLILLDCH